MFTKRLLFLVLVGYFGLFAFEENSLGADEAVVAPQVYSVGAARVDVTPNTPVRLSGFGFRREESEGIQSPIYARALAIGTDEEGPTILITLDSTGISDAVVTEVSKQLAQDGISREKFAITTTHTHTAPMLKGILPTLFGQPIPDAHQKHIDQYTKELTEHLVEVSRSALKARQPAELWWGTGQVAFSKNRRSPETGPVDHGLPVLVAKSTDGKPFAVLATYACHAVTLSHNLVGGDWAGFASETIERMHPGVVGMISIGCGADQNPISGVTGDKVDVAQSQGLELATEVDRVLKNAMKPISGSLTGRIERFNLPLAELPPRSYWEERVKVGSYIGHHAQVQLDTLDRGEELATSVPYSVQTITFGESLGMVFLPGEVVVDYAIRLRKEFDPTRVWVMAYANDTPCYIPSERVLQEGGYEGGSAMTYYNKPAKLAPGVEQLIFDSITRLLPASYKNKQTAKADAGLPPLSPVQSLSRLTLPADWTAQVVAAEPLTIDPVAFDFGPDGALWVCEMHDYPSGLAGNFEPGGKVRLLRDVDNDGIYDRSTLFIDNLPFPTGVTVWKKGVLICAAPDIIYAEDTNGDGKADIRRVLFSGFGTENYQARVNSLTYGLDGWVYGACGLFGGNIKSHITGETVPLGNRDFRIDPDQGILEPLTGRTQQGRVRNDQGDWFGCSNGQPCWHYPLLTGESRPGLATAPLITSVPSGNGRQLFPEIEDYQRFKLSGPAGQVTAACGLGIYRDDWLGHNLSGNAIVCEPVNLLLHRRVLEPNGLTFTGKRAAGEDASEIVTSTDNWFRPVQVRTGPDGGLWVADMSRGVIEHPRWIPEELRENLDVRAGDRQGRIIRILPTGLKARPTPVLSEMTSAQLVETLKSPNGIQRDLAQQLLFWNPDDSVIPDLRVLATSESSTPSRVAALWVLARYDALTFNTLQNALSASDPQLRRQAARVIAEQTQKIEQPEKLLQVLRNEKDLLVIRELVEALRSLKTDSSTQWLAELYPHYLQDRYLRFTILRAVDDAHWGLFVSQVLMNIEATQQTLSLVEPLLSISLASHNEAAMKPLLATILPAKGKTARFPSLVEQVAVAVARNPKLAANWFDQESKQRLQALKADARSHIGNEELAESVRLSAAGLLGLDPEDVDSDLDLLAAQLGSQSSPALQLRLILVMGRTAHVRVPELLFDKWTSLGPSANQKILDLLLSRHEYTMQFLTAIEEKEIAPNVLDATRRQILLQHPNAEVKSRAESVFKTSTDSTRAAVIEKYRTTLSLTGNPEHGAKVYQKNCRICHQLNDQGFAVGPALSESKNKAWSALLNSVLNPNEAVDQRYAVYVAATVDGRVQQGLLTSEDRESITLKGQEAKLTTIPRNEIEVLQSTGRSMMPEGLEKEMTAQDFADIFAYITERNESGEENVESLAVVAQKLLDDDVPTQTRQDYLAKHLHDPSGLIQQMVDDLPANDLDEEYRRIPWIWRVAIAAGKENDTQKLQAILESCLPKLDGKLTDWQSVVIGGGVVNGISIQGDWPHERIAELIGNDRDLRSRWLHTISEAEKMSDNEAIKPGTRYDALRIIAMSGWDRSGQQLVSYIGDKGKPQLQMGAVSGLVDVPDPPATQALISHLHQLNPTNLQLAIDGLLRSEAREIALVNAIVEGKVNKDLLNEKARDALKNSRSKNVQEAARKIFSE